MRLYPLFGISHRITSADIVVDEQTTIPQDSAHWLSFCCLAAISLRLFRPVPPARWPGKIMRAVLPFQNFTGDPSKEYLADGLTEETISQLSRLNPEQLGVIAPTLENSLRESGDHLRLTAQPIQVKDQTHLWSQVYDYPTKNIHDVEDDLAKEVAHKFQLPLTSQRQGELARTHPVNAEAYDAYMKGPYFFQRGDDDKDTNMAATYFERATRLDPSYALAWVGLSRVRCWQT